MWKAFDFSSNFSPSLAVLFAILVFVDLILKGIGLWKSARNGQKYWFVGLLIVNSLGILPLIYLTFFEKGRKKSTQK